MEEPAGTTSPQCTGTKAPDFSIADARDYHPFIDGLRGLAILMVLATHTAQFVSYGRRFSFSSVDILLASGARGVQLFFMVSAFTLFSSSYRRFKSDRFPKTYFYIRRAFRILPFWWVVIAAISIARRNPFGTVAPSLFFYFGFIRFDASYDINPQGWSLFDEECFYLLLPLIFSQISSLRRALQFCVICVIIHALWSIGAPRIGVPTANGFVGLFPLNQWFCFAFGIAIYYYSRQQLSLPSLIARTQIPYLADLLWSTLYAISIGVYLTETRLHVAWLVSAALALALLFIVSMDSSTFIGKAVRNRLLMRFGGYCYSIYLFHVPMLGLLDPVRKWAFAHAGIDGWPVELQFALYYPTIAFITLGLGAISFNLIEKPCVNAGRLFIRKIDQRK